MENRYVKILIFLILVVFFSAVLLLLALLIFFLITPSSFSPSPHTYQVISVNPKRTTTSIGVAQLTQEIDKEKYLSYANQETGNTVFIQNLGGEEFSCTGSCFCKSNTRRATGATSTLLTRSLTVIISSLTVFQASKMAEESLRDHCNQEFYDFCDEQDLDVRVACSAEKKDDVFEKHMKERTLGQAWRSGLPIPDLMEFDCSGSCVEDERWANYEMSEEFFRRRAKWLDENGPCEKLKLDMRLVLYGGEIDVAKMRRSPNEAGYVAEDIFIKREMKEFCEEMSRLPEPPKKRGRKKKSDSEINTVCMHPPKFTERVLKQMGGVRGCTLKYTHWKGNDFVGDNPNRIDTW